MFRSPDVMIGMTHHNHDVYTDIALKSLFGSTKDPLMVFVMDDGSDVPYKVKIEAPRGSTIAVVRNPEPQGCLAVWNDIVTRWASMRDGPDYLLITNNDVVFARGALEAMKWCFEEEADCGIVGPITNAPGHVPQQGTGEPREEVGSFLSRASGASPESFPVTFVNGFCFMLRRDRLVSDDIEKRRRPLKTWALPKRVVTNTFRPEIPGEKNYGGEDTYQDRMREAGYSAYIACGAYVYHFKDVSMESHRRGRMGMSLATLPRRIAEVGVGRG